jgi:hypothetical protein
MHLPARACCDAAGWRTALFQGLGAVLAYYLKPFGNQVKGYGLNGQEEQPRQNRSVRHFGGGSNDLEQCHRAQTPMGAFGAIGRQ